MTNNRTKLNNETPLESWKEISAYLTRDVRTVTRWEKSEGLPVHRHQHSRGSTVYAYPSELEAWRVARKPKAGEELQRPPWRRLIPALAGGLALLAVAAVVLRGPILNPPGPLAEAANVGDGISAKQVWSAPGRYPLRGSVSPDGRHFFDGFRGPGRDLVVRDLARGENRVLTNNAVGEQCGYPVISPDGRQLAYFQGLGVETSELRIIDVGGSNRRVLVADSEIPWLHPFDWSPDGSTILAMLWRKDKNGQIALVSVEDGTARILKSLEWRYPTRMDFSPDGKFIVYDVQTRRDSPNRDIYILSADGSLESLAVDHPSNDRSPVWTPDRQSILFLSNRTGKTGYWTVSVDQGKPRGAPRLVKADTGDVLPIGFTDEGVYYHSTKTSLQDVYLATLDPVTGRIQGEPELASATLRGGNTLPEWSPDGRRLAYFSRRGSPHRGVSSGVTVVRSLDGQERETPLPMEVYDDGRLRWSPDGKVVMFSGREGREKGLYLLNVGSGKVSVVALGRLLPEIWHSAWLPDSKHIFYVRDENRQGCEIRLRNLETGTERVFYRPDSPAHLNNLELSPSGEYLAFGHTREPYHYELEDLMIMPVEGGEARTILELDRKSQSGRAYSIEWTRDGKHLLMGRRLGAPTVPSELWRVPVAGGEPENLGLPVWGRGGLSMHPDGKRLAYTYQGGTVELWALENFPPQVRAAP